MGIGLEVYNSAGQLATDLTTPLARLLGSYFAPAGSSGSASFPGVNNLLIGFANPVASTVDQVPHVVTISGTSVSWAPASGVPSGFHAASQITVFTYA